MNTNIVIGIVIVLIIIIGGFLFLVGDTSDVSEEVSTIKVSGEAGDANTTKSSNDSDDADTVLGNIANQNDASGTVSESAGASSESSKITTDPAVNSAPSTDGGTSESAEQATDEGGVETEPQGNIVIYTNSGFSPGTIEIALGESVIWENESSRSLWVASAFHPTHTVYPEKSEDNCLGSDFDSCVVFGNGGSYSFTFTSAGTWNYHNHLSPGRIGKVIVK